MRSFKCIAGGCDHQLRNVPRLLTTRHGVQWGKSRMYYWSCVDCGHLASSEAEATRLNHPSGWFLAALWVAAIGIGSIAVYAAAYWGLR